MVGLLWCIWKTRNSNVFQDEIPNQVPILIKAKKANAKWCIRYKITQSIQPPNSRILAINPKKTPWIAWEKPHEGLIKVNFDGSKSRQQALGGYVMHNWTGSLIQTGALNLVMASILVTEATTMRNVITAAVQTKFTNIYIEGIKKFPSN